MDPIKTCDRLLNCIKNSNLNFHLIETPFSLSISVRKSFIKDKNGVLLPSQHQTNSDCALDSSSSRSYDDLKAKNSILEETVSKLKQNFQKELNDKDGTIHELDILS